MSAKSLEASEELENPQIIETVSARLEEKATTSLELTENCLKKIFASNEKQRLFITVTDELARQEANESDRRIIASKRKSKLDGIPFAIKDNFFLKGVRCTAGSKILSNFVPDYTATVVERLIDSGSVIVGATNLHEFASGATNVNPHFGATRNPWDNDRITGGSSGGSAGAVVEGMALAALGTDTSGSVRIPASLCGLVGLKPTFGLVSSRGTIPLSWSFDHVGILAHSCIDTAIVLDVIAGYDEMDPGSAKAPRKYDYLVETTKATERNFKIGVLRGYFLDMVDDDVRRAFEQVVRDLQSVGYELKDAEIPDVEHSGEIWAPIRFAEASAYHASWFETRPQDYGEDVRAKLERGKRYTATEYVLAKRKAIEFKETMNNVLEKYDVLISPTVPISAPRIDELNVSIGSTTIDVYSALVRQTQPFNVTGFPAVSVPMGLSKQNKMPLGLQIIGRPFDEAMILALGSVYEKQTSALMRRM